MPNAAPRRALIMAGGGLKVAFQAGVLQVWLDETVLAGTTTKVDFDIADGASGGVFNLAMWCQGLTGTEIANRWRSTKPLPSLRPNVGRWLPHFDSLLTYDRFRRLVLRGTWYLDWSLITSTNRMASFNLFNVTKQQHEVVEASEMDEDALVSAVSLPVWFPAVDRGGDSYIDAVYATDANLERVIQEGADELWVIWTVGQRGSWRPGLVNEYFQVIEAAANSKVRAFLERIKQNNQAELAYQAAGGGGRGEFGREIKVRWLSAEVPLHYLFVFTRAGFRDAADRGVKAARAWVLAQTDLDLIGPPQPAQNPPNITFQEFFVGNFAFTTDPSSYDWDTRTNVDLKLDLNATIESLDAFLADVQRRVAVGGKIQSPVLGVEQQIEDGVLWWFVDEGDPRCKQLVYRLKFRTDQVEYTLFGRKFVVHDEKWDLWTDTTDLHCKIYEGWIDEENPLLLRGVGLTKISFPHFLASLASFRSSGGVLTLLNFLNMFLRQLWMVYHGPLIPLGPCGVPTPPTQPPALGAAGDPVPTTTPPMPWS